MRKKCMYVESILAWSNNCIGNILRQRQTQRGRARLSQRKEQTSTLLLRAKNWSGNCRNGRGLRGPANKEMKKKKVAHIKRQLWASGIDSHRSTSRSLPAIPLGYQAMQKCSGCEECSLPLSKLAVIMSQTISEQKVSHSVNPLRLVLRELPSCWPEFGFWRFTYRRRKI